MAASANATVRVWGTDKEEERGPCLAARGGAGSGAAAVFDRSATRGRRGPRLQCKERLLGPGRAGRAGRAGRGRVEWLGGAGRGAAVTLDIHGLPVAGPLAVCALVTRTEGNF